MDKPVYDELRQMTGNGVQTIIVPTSFTVNGDWYRIEFPTGGTIRTISIDGQRDPTPLLNLSVPSGTYLSNVSSIYIIEGVAIAYSNKL